MRILELTGINDTQYINQIEPLEGKIKLRMDEDGRYNQFFSTDTEEILSYAKSKENSVWAAIDDNDQVVSATFITKGQSWFSYNDLTKYCI